MLAFRDFVWSQIGEGCMPGKQDRSPTKDFSETHSHHLHSKEYEDALSYQLAEERCEDRHLKCVQRWKTSPRRKVKNLIRLGEPSNLDDVPMVVEAPPQGICRVPFTMTSSPGKSMELDMGGCIAVPRRINFSPASSQEKPDVDFNALRDPDWERRRDAVQALGSCFLGRHPGEFNQDAANLIMPALRAALRDERWEVRRQATKSVSALGPEAVWHLCSVLWETCSDPEQPVRQAALDALEAHGQELPPARLRQPRVLSRSWQEPPSLAKVQEEDCPSDDEDLSTTASSNPTSLYSSRPSSKGSATADSTTECTSPRTFTMSIGKPVGTELGLDVDLGHRDCLKVLVVQGGIVETWNKKQVWDSSKVEAGDLIREVNGKHGTAKELMALFKRSTWLEVLIEKPLVPFDEHEL